MLWNPLLKRLLCDSRVKVLTPGGTSKPQLGTHFSDLMFKGHVFWLQYPCWFWQNPFSISKKVTELFLFLWFFHIYNTRAARFKTGLKQTAFVSVGHGTKLSSIMLIFFKYTKIEMFLRTQDDVCVTLSLNSVNPKKCLFD